MSAPSVMAGEVAPAIAAELPGLGLRWCAFGVSGDVTRRSPDALRERLRALSDRHRGATVLAARSRAIPHAYRTLFRHVGLDPDEQRIPVEALMAERLAHGAYRSRGLLADALAVATLDTGVGVWALDAERLDGPLRLALDGGRIVVADGAGAIAPLFAPPPAVTGRTRRLALYAIVAPDVPVLAADEALLTASELLS